MINKNIIFCLEYFLLIFLVGCTAFKNVPGEEYQYEQLSETPGIDAYQAIETIYSPEDAALMEEDFYEEAKLWRYAAQKEVFVCRGKGSYFQIQGVVGSATRIQTGTSTASWVQLYNNYNASFPSLSVDFVGSGYFTESRTHSGGGSVNINGFNLTGSTAYTDTYSSDTMSLIWTYKLYA